MNICVFCSAQDVAEKYQNAAREFATLIGKNNHTLVWGGSDMGTMKIIADAVEAAGGKLFGISLDAYKHNARPNVENMLKVMTLGERKTLLLEKSDAIVVLPGGLGTLDEVTEVLELKKQGAHDKPIVFLNTDGFYDGFKMQFERMDAEGFLPRALHEFLLFVDTPEAAMRYIQEYGEN
jgi:uncharacterized protein (TIGR00730 family)